MRAGAVNNGTQFVPVISISYGGCEQEYFTAAQIQDLEQVLEMANAQGQTVVAASGDSGSADCDTGTNSNGQVTGATQGLAVDYPPSSQYVTAAGGTSFSGDLTDQAKYWNSANNANNGSAISYIPETTWNDTPTLADLMNPNIGDNELSASGGGASSLFNKPSWQVGTGAPNDGKRDVPDVALAADPNHDGYVLCTEETNSEGTELTGVSSCAYPLSGSEVPYFDASGNGNVYGGTSIAAPQWAAMITLWNQEEGNTAGIGNANPALYQSAQTTPGAFHDVTTGSNAVVCEEGSPDCISNGSGAYVMSCCNAGTGYDEATGLGSVDATAMAAVWPTITAAVSPSFTVSGTPVTVAPGAIAENISTITVTPAGGFTGSVALTAVVTSSPAGAQDPPTLSFGSTSPVSINSTAAGTATLTITTTSSALAYLFDSGVHWYPADGAVLTCILLFGISARRRSWRTILGMLVFLIVLTSGMVACGGSGGSSGGGGPSNPGTTAGTYTVTVTGISGTTTATSIVTVTVQ